MRNLIDCVNVYNVILLQSHVKIFVFSKNESGHVCCIHYNVKLTNTYHLCLHGVIVFYYVFFNIILVVYPLKKNLKRNVINAQDGNTVGTYAFRFSSKFQRTL